MGVVGQDRYIIVCMSVCVCREYQAWTSESLNTVYIIYACELYI